MASLVAFSHLRWDRGFQRPQHLLTRFAWYGNVVFIEEPVFDPGPPFVETSDPCANVRVLRAHTPIRAEGFDDDQIDLLLQLLGPAIKAASIGDYSAWFYTPMAQPLLRMLTPRAVIYDCVDEPGAHAPQPWMFERREQALLEQADVVFTSSPSSHAARRGSHPSIHCVPSAVDVEHFAQGCEPINAHPVLASLGRPRAGFIGVVDERFDCALLAALADARPEWQMCIVGPVLNIEFARLPRRPNIHYYGQHSYTDLPSFLAGWDLCLLPFVVDKAPRFNGSSGALEYMAAERPVVSTPTSDVLQIYGNSVLIGHSTAEFIDACERALGETPQQSAQRRLRMRRRVAGLSWDNTAVAMMNMVEHAADRRSIGAGGEPPATPQADLLTAAH